MNYFINDIFKQVLVRAYKEYEIYNQINFKELDRHLRHYYLHTPTTFSNAIDVSIAFENASRHHQDYSYINFHKAFRLYTSIICGVMIDYMGELIFEELLKCQDIKKGKRKAIINDVKHSLQLLKLEIGYGYSILTFFEKICNVLKKNGFVKCRYDLSYRLIERLRHNYFHVKITKEHLINVLNIN